MIDEIWADHMVHKTWPSKEFDGTVSDQVRVHPSLEIGVSEVRQIDSDKDKTFVITTSL